MTISKKAHLARTISVKGHFGDLDLTKESFASRWMAHATELRKLSSNTVWQKNVDRMVSKTRVFAHIEFEHKYEEQNK